MQHEPATEVEGLGSDTVEITHVVAIAVLEASWIDWVDKCPSIIHLYPSLLHWLAETLGLLGTAQPSLTTVRKREKIFVCLSIPTNEFLSHDSSIVSERKCSIFFSLIYLIRKHLCVKYVLIETMT